jgi:hypothetical protein
MAMRPVGVRNSFNSIQPDRGGVVFGVKGCTCNRGVAWGDVNDNSNINPVDVISMVQNVYLGNDMRGQPPNCPYSFVDLDGNHPVNPMDVICLVNAVV